MARKKGKKKDKKSKPSSGGATDVMRKRAWASAALGGETKKRLFLIGILAVLLIVIAVICIVNRNKDKNKVEDQIGQYYVKQMQCYQDADCPDGSFCDGLGLCVTTDLLPIPRARNVLGRGRAAEGETIKASGRNQGQKDSD